MELENEIWEDIPGYEGLYKVSNLGNVYSYSKTWVHGRGRISNHEGFMFTPHINVYGYCIVTLRKNKKSNSVKVHRLVSKAFVPNPENKKQVNHKNCIKTDNRAENLEWATNEENYAHAKKNGLINKGADTHNAILVLNTQTGVFYDTIKDAAATIGMHRAYLSALLGGKYRNKTPFIIA